MAQQWQRKTVALTPSMWRRIDDARFALRMKTEQETIRVLLDMALLQLGHDERPQPPQKKKSRRR